VYRAVAANLKLTYAQFQELETFARFGARLDPNSHDIITNGQRIRACLKQPQSSPVTVVAQITILIALTEKLFDNVPLPQMKDAEKALNQAASTLPEPLLNAINSGKKLSDQERSSIIDIARKTLASFQSVSEDDK